MINIFNEKVLYPLGVRFPETPLEAYENVKWKLCRIDRILQVGVSIGMGILGLVLEKMDCFTKHPELIPSSTVATTLTIPATEGISVDIVLSTITSLITSAEEHTTGTNTTRPLFSTALSMMTGNEIAETSNGTLSSNSSIAQRLSAIYPSNGFPEPDYCEPMSALSAMIGVVLFVWKVVKIVRRCRGSGEGRCAPRLVVASDILLLGASGISFVGNALRLACIPGPEIDNIPVCEELSSMVLVSSILYFTHAGVLVLSAVCNNRSIQKNTTEEQEGFLYQVADLHREEDV
ncbi:hypothetical protein CLAVI_000260 [Candidatus Clavichlamydia salmonicola]|uniref:hypothetical protein n=1 Tax=Candidatus Clavichlamydia salmonicola TaxID=469812 RepID=UPI0018919976|nr:hypothetical protein [Candidatus Clavichlamydia salmonicola]MBF5050646.1 hypothetical protein [Candidatus Clavichlamydia salmonicola]